MLRSYALAPETLRRMMRNLFWRFQLIVTLSFFGFGLFLASTGRPVRWSVVLPMVIVIALAYFFIIYFNFRQQLRLLYSIRYELDGSSLIYRQIGRSPLRIMRSDIVSVSERRNGLYIQTNDSNIDLLVTRGLSHTGDKDVRETFDAWVGIQSLPPRLRNARMLTVGGVLIGLLIVLVINNLWWTGALGVALVAGGVIAERRWLPGQTATPGTMQMYSMAITFLIFLVVMKSCFLAVTMLAMR